jgi:putative DNA primase/helicase
MATAAIAYRQNELEQFLAEIWPAKTRDDKPPPSLPVEPLDLADEELLALARDAANGDKFSKLYAGDWNGAGFTSHSEGDLAFCGMSAFWFGRDRDRMDRLFRRSGLYRDKWDRAGYRNKTLDKAISECREVYKPPRARTEPGNGEPPPIEWREGFTSEKPTGTGDTDAADQERDGGDQFTPEELFEAASSEQDGDAALFVKLYRSCLAYDHSSGKWYEWAGNYWKEDLLNEPVAAVEAVTELYEKEAKRLSWASITAAKAGRDDEAKKAESRRKVFLRKISCLQKLPWKLSVLQLAASGKDSLGITGEEWDREPWVLPCINGVVNLKDGSFRPGRPEDYFKTVCPTEWKGLDEPARAWEDFQRTITDDEDLPDFKCRLYGSTMPGMVIERVLSIFDGPGGQNGKGTELEGLHAILGPLAGPIPSELLLKQDRPQNPDAPTASIMALRGKRIVWASETERGRAFNTQKVKWLTGADTLTGRDPYGKRQVTFPPSHSVFLLTNDKPSVPASDHAFWERVVLIKFPFTFKDKPSGPNERQKDANLIEKLKAEASGILAWLVRGCLEWQKEGLNPPKSVLEHKKEYRKAEDQLARFIEERCITGPDLEVKSGILFKAYQAWCEETGEKACGLNEFGKEMKIKFDSYRINRGVFYTGMGLLTNASVG